jgi:hypothetical protein
MPFSEAQINMVVDFWTRVSCNPKQQMDRPGNADPTALMASMLLAMQGDRWGGRRDDFAASLKTLLLAAPGDRTLCVATDYHPDQLLAEAVWAAGVEHVSMGMLPIKTTTWLIPNGTVDVRYGYGADIQHFATMAQMDQWLTEQGH